MFFLAFLKAISLNFASLLQLLTNQFRFMVQWDMRNEQYVNPISKQNYPSIFQEDHTTLMLSHRFIHQKVDLHKHSFTGVEKRHTAELYRTNNPYRLVDTSIDDNLFMWSKEDIGGLKISQLTREVNSVRNQIDNTGHPEVSKVDRFLFYTGLNPNGFSAEDKDLLKEVVPKITEEEKETRELSINEQQILYDSRPKPKGIASHYKSLGYCDFLNENRVLEQNSNKESEDYRDMPWDNFILRELPDMGVSEQF